MDGASDGILQKLNLVSILHVVLRPSQLATNSAACESGSLALKDRKLKHSQFHRILSLKFY